MKFMLYITLLSSLLSCKKIKNEFNIDEDKLEEIGQSIMNNSTIDLLIRKKSFLGITINDSINKHELLLTKNSSSINIDNYTLSTVQYDSLAQIITSPDNKFIISDIIVTSSEAFTELGLKVGSTFKDIKDNIRYYEIKQTDNGTTYVQDSIFKYMLNYNKKTANSSISDTIKIKQIIINNKK
ncbi:hypothetical protein FIA58_014500 [Flavobacterium jejuense]|uniref:Lipoprotein n=1 Tax=Flavobacterium jejuense TaxID=1544455 RepID=A0ABX0IVU5_9FLAO|nr:hypothetical protein [Flavobacterium jejuense]NHN26892.1 hypothetical protein [Flavobacterium jejuense]